MPDPKNPLSDSETDDFDALLDALGDDPAGGAAAAPAPAPAARPAARPLPTGGAIGARTPIGAAPAARPLPTGGAIGARTPIGAVPAAPAAPAAPPGGGRAPITAATRPAITAGARGPAITAGARGPAITAGARPPIGAPPAGAAPTPPAPVAGARPIASARGPAIGVGARPATRAPAPAPAPAPRAAAPAPAPRAPAFDDEGETTFALPEDALQASAGGDTTPPAATDAASAAGAELSLPPLEAPSFDDGAVTGEVAAPAGDDAGFELDAAGPRTDPPPAEDGPRTDPPPALDAGDGFDLAPGEEPAEEASGLALDGAPLDAGEPAEEPAASDDGGSEEAELSGDGDDDGPVFETSDEDGEETISIEVSDEEDVPAPAPAPRQPDRGAALAATVTSRKKLVDVTDDMYALDARGEVESRVALLLGEADTATSLERTADMLCMAGELIDGVLGDRARAKEVFERAYAAAPSHVFTLRALRRVATAEGDVARAIELVDAELALPLSDVEAQELVSVSAELNAADSAAGAEARWEQIAAEGGVRAALASLFVGGSRHDSGAMGDALGAIGQVSSGALAGAANLARARLAEGSAEADTALAAVQEAVRRDPSDVGSWLAMARIAVGRESAQTFREALTGLASAGTESSVGVAAVALERALSSVLSDAVPDGTVASAGVEGWLVAHALRDAGRDDHAQVAAALAAAVDDAQAARWRELGRAADAQAASSDASEVGRFFALQRAASSSDPVALASAAGALLGDDEPLERAAVEAALLAARGAVAPAEASVLAGDRGVFLGALAGAALAASQGADAADAQVPPATEGAFERLAAIERALADAASRGESGADEGRPALEALATEFAGTGVAAFAARESARLEGSTAALAATLAAEAEGVTEPARGAALRFVSAALEAGEEDPAIPARGYEAARTLPGDLAAAELVALFGLRGQLASADVAAALQSGAGDRATTAQRMAAVRAALRTAEEDPTAASAQLVQVWEATRSDGALGTLALRALPGDDVEHRVAILRDLAERAQGAAAGAAVASWALLAEALADAGRPAEAAQALARARTQALNDPGLLAWEEALWLRAGMFAEVAERSFDALKSATTDAARIAAYEKLAELDSTFRGDVASAVLTYQAILELAPGHMPSLRTLERYFLQQGRYEELAVVYERLIKHVGDVEDAVGVGHMAARLAIQQADGEVSAGAPYWAASFARGKADLRTTLSLEGEARRTGALGTLTQAALYAETLVEDAREKATFLARAGECLLLEGKTAEAVDVLSRAVALDERNPAAKSWLALGLERSERFTDAAEAYEALAGLGRAPAHQARAYLSAGALWQDRVRDTARARAALEQVLDREPGNVAAFDRLTRLLRDANDLPAELSRTQARLDLSGDPMEVLPLYLRAAELSEALGDDASARTSLQTALDLDPERVAALRALARLARGAQDWSTAADVLTRLAQLTTDEGERIEALYALGEAYDLHLSSERDAEAAYKRVLELKPGEPRALMRLADLYVRTGEPENEAEALHALVKAHKPGAGRRALQIRLAAVQSEKLNDAKTAEETLELARKELPSDLDVLRAFSRLFQATDQADKLGALLDRAAADVRRKLEAEADDIALLELLAELYKLRGKIDGAKVVASVSQALGLRSDKLAPLAPNGVIGGAGSGTITPEVLDLLAPPALTAAHREVFRLGADVLEKLMPFEPGAMRAEKLGARPHPLRDDAERWARTLGLDGIEIYTGPNHPLVVLPVGRHPPAIMVPTNIENGPAARFALIRAIALVSLSCSLLVRLKPESLSLMLVALSKQFDPNYTNASVDAAKVEDVARRLTRALPRPRQAEMAEHGAALTKAAETTDGEALQQAALELANRLAVLATGDMAGAVAALAPAGTDARAAAAQGQAVTRLLRTVVTDRFLDARRESGADRRAPSLG